METVYGHKDIELAYLSGLIDADGCIGVYHPYKNHYPNYVVPRVSIGCKIGISLNLAKKVFGGNILKNKDGFFEWRASQANTEEVCRSLKEFLKIKSRQARIIDKPTCDLYQINKRYNAENHEYLEPSIIDTKESLTDAYSAGILDGEGCLHIDKCLSKKYKKHYYSLRVIFTNKNRKLLEWLKKKYGGSISGLHLRICSNQGADCLRRLLPYLITKKDQALLCIEFQELLKNSKNKKIIGSRRNIDINQCRIREEYRLKCKMLKQ